MGGLFCFVNMSSRAFEFDSFIFAVLSIGSLEVMCNCPKKKTTSSAEQLAQRA